MPSRRTQLHRRRLRLATIRHVCCDCYPAHGRADVAEGLAYVERMRNYAINSTPVVVKNVVIAGANIQDLPQTKEQPRGDIFGFDARTGKKLWTFHSIPQKGELGNDTWENGSAEYTGATNVWSMITVDEELGYIKTDDTFFGVLADARSELAAKLSDGDGSSGARQKVADLLDEVSSMLRGQGRPKP